MTNNFSNGASYLLKGFRLLKRPRVLPLVLIPVLLNIALFYLGIDYLYDSFDQWLNGLLNRIPDWLSFIKWLLWPLFSLFILLLLAYGFTFIANLIGSPFYGLIAEQVEIIATGKSTDIPLTLKSILSIALQSIGREVQKLVQYLLWLIPLLILSVISLIITPLATIMPFIWFLFGAWMLAVQYIDYAYDNNQINFSSLKADLKSDRTAALGFGAITTLASMIPLLNILTIPAAVCGGTLFYVDRLATNNTPTKSNQTTALKEG